jgi:hypothetical protein
MTPWETIAVVDVGPHESGGVKWGGTVVYQRFNYVRTTRKKSKGWRRHVRTIKAARKRSL